MIKYTENFINENEQSFIYDWVRNRKPKIPKNAPNATHVIDKDNMMDDGTLNGWGESYRFSYTPVTQGTFKYNGENVEINSVPYLFWEIRDRIASHLNIPSDHSFLSIWVMFKDAFIRPHYDMGFPGHITLKCNIAIKCPEDNGIIIKKKFHPISERSLIAFEASLYRHEVKPVKNERINFCYGFAIPCEKLGRDINSPRMRRSLKQWQNSETLGG